MTVSLNCIARCSMLLSKYNINSDCEQHRHNIDLLDCSSALLPYCRWHSERRLKHVLLEAVYKTAQLKPDPEDFPGYLVAVLRY